MEKTADMSKERPEDKILFAALVASAKPELTFTDHQIARAAAREALRLLKQAMADARRNNPRQLSSLSGPWGAGPTVDQVLRALVLEDSEIEHVYADMIGGLNP